MNVWQVLNEAFELPSRYKINEFLGSGAYGVVVSAYDNILKHTVAIKKCKKIFQSRTLAKRILREIRLLRLLQHTNIIELKTLLPPPDVNDFNEVYVVFESMETDLGQVIRSQQALYTEHVQFFSFQLLQGLNYLHSQGVIHRDLKYPRPIFTKKYNSHRLLFLGRGIYWSTRTAY